MSAKKHPCATQLPQRASTHSLFGQLRGLHSVTEKLYRNEIYCGSDIEKLTEEQFFQKLGRIRPTVRATIKDRMGQLGLHFQPS